MTNLVTLEEYKRYKGINSEKIRECLLKETDLTLMHAEQLANSVISAENSSKVIHQNHVFSMKHRQRSKSRDRNCYTCGKPGHLSKDCYKNKKCTNCSKFGHTSDYCKRKKSHNSNKLYAINTDFSNLKFISCNFLGLSVPLSLTHVQPFLY